MPVIEVIHLHKRYRDQVAVHDVSLQVEQGEIFGILGPNGAGKTTTVECMGGLRRPDGGTVRVLGLDPQRDVAELRAVLGMQLQRSELPERITVREALELFASFYRTPAEPRRLLEEWGLTGKRDSAFGSLSGGQRQRLSIALALVGRPAAGQRVRFRPSLPIDDGLLTDLPEVSAIHRTGAVVEVTGCGDLLQAVTSVLARHQIVVADLRVEQASLDDAFVALTGRGTED